MIDATQLNIDWISKVSKSNRNVDKILVEKVIRALLLLEGLVQAEVPFVFKCGTSLMLHFNSSKRLSIDIDIDIIVAQKVEFLDEILSSVASKQGFTRVEPQLRITQSDIEKAHYKFFYAPIHKTAKEEEYILLDILFEEIAYAQIVKLPIVSPFVPVKGDPITVRVPCLEDLLGDKLTAFAPNSTGIPYYKGEDSMSMEIIKQLYDIGNLFDRSANLTIIKETFHRFVKQSWLTERQATKMKLMCWQTSFIRHFALQVEVNWVKEILMSYSQVSGEWPDSSFPKTSTSKKPLFPHPKPLTFPR